jgi:hypothetical protein
MPRTALAVGEFGLRPVEGFKPCYGVKPNPRCPSSDSKPIADPDKLPS